jgi:hypothetical protein
VPVGRASIIDVFGVVHVINSNGSGQKSSQTAPAPGCGLGMSSFSGLGSCLGSESVLKVKVMLGLWVGRCSPLHEMKRRFIHWYR